MNTLLEKRMSPYDFDPQAELDKNTAELLIKAASSAPSSYNEQPWKFFYGLKQNEVGFKKLHNVLLDANKPWSADASMLIMGVAETTFSRNGKPNRHAFYDLGQSVFALSIQATELDLHLHQMGGFDIDKAKSALGLTDSQEPVVMVAIGKRISNEPKDRARKPLNEIATEL